jgi:GTP pyrophosphokinase
MSFDQFLKAIPHKFSNDEVALLERALTFASTAHEGQKRKSGEDYITHPMEAAVILGQIFPDATSMAALFLHDVPEDTGKTIEDIRREFGDTITHLVDGVTKLGSVRLRNSNV